MSPYSLANTKMRDFCSGCGETFLDENMDNCNCGRSLCYACMAIHKQESGHKKINPYPNQHVLLNECFDEELVDIINREILASERITSVLTTAHGNSLSSQINYYDSENQSKCVIYKMSYLEYVELFKCLNEHIYRVCDYYADSAIKATMVKVSHLEKSTGNEFRQNQSIDANSIVTPLRHKITKVTLIILSAILFYLAIKNIF